MQGKGDAMSKSTALIIQTCAIVATIWIGIIMLQIDRIAEAVTK
jgi:hypothetical protein